MRTRRRPPELLFIGRSSPLLFGGLAACSATLRESEVVAVVALRANQVVELKRPVLSAGKAPKTIEYDVFTCCKSTCTGTQTFMEEQAMSTESFNEVLDGGVRDVECSRDLSVPRATNFAPKDGFEQIGPS